MSYLCMYNTVFSTECFRHLQCKFKRPVSFALQVSRWSLRALSWPQNTLSHYVQLILELTINTHTHTHTPTLKAVLFLYSKEFPMLGHVQSGNIFVDDKDVCHLGGYENTLLGYKTRLYRLCRNYLQHFDVIMFGTINHTNMYMYREATNLCVKCIICKSIAIHINFYCTMHYNA